MVTGLTFSASVNVAPGDNTVRVSATNTHGTLSHGYDITVTGDDPRSYSYDANGNLTSDGVNTYRWDAANRLLGITYPGSSQTSFTYDGLGRRVSIVESTGGTITGTKNFVWSGLMMAEERNASNCVTRRFYDQGEQISRTNYYYAKDHLGSIRELTDSSGALEARYDYDPYGNRTRTGGVASFDADFGFTGHYFHSPSGLDLTLYRAYSASTGRWLSRDPIAEEGGVNLYKYVVNDPLRNVDPIGLLSADAQKVVDSALKQSGGDLEGAWNLVLQKRFKNPKCPALRDAEHFLWAANDTYEHGLFGGLIEDISITLYTPYKAVLQAVGQLPPDTSAPSWSEMGAGYQGVGEGVCRLYQ
jgi:RHS repeat-associated protein